MYTVVYCDAEPIRQYGIQGEKFSLKNITTEEEQIMNLVNMLNQYRVSEIHITDVLEDWFGASVYKELGL